MLVNLIDWRTVITTLILPMISMCVMAPATGCTTTTEGRKISSVGYSSTSELFVKSEAVATDPDAKHKVTIEVNQGLLDWWMAKNTVPATAAVTPLVDVKPDPLPK